MSVASAAPLDSGVTVLVGHSARLVRAGISALVESMGEVRYVVEANAGTEVLRHLTEDSQPDVALVDVAMPGLNGIEVVSRAIAAGSRSVILLFSQSDNPLYERRATAAGAYGFYGRESTWTDIEEALRTIAAGRPRVNLPRRPRTLVSRRMADGGDPVEHLTPRQREVLQLIGEGQSTKEIAVSLGLSPKTVEVYRSQLMQRLGVRGLARLVRTAIMFKVVHI